MGKEWRHDMERNGWYTDASATCRECGAHPMRKTDDPNVVLCECGQLGENPLECMELFIAHGLEFSPASASGS